MKPEIIVIASLFLGFAVLEMIFTNFWRKPGQTRDDVISEWASGLTLLAITQPFVLFSGAFLMSKAFPQYADALIGIPIIVQVLLLLIFDDMTQYWYHRASHTFPWLYKLHRPHHNAPYMSIRLVYRNNLFYYLTMPGLWFSGALIYLGLGWTYAFYIVAKMLVIYGAHSDVRWDKPLYKISALSPLMWILERTISTPATHNAHHGRHKDDGVTHYKGNYGNLLFFWDVLFGTAKITRQYPEKFGVENLPATTLGEQLVWPLKSASTTEGLKPAE